ncbi:hypothetical protein Tco_1226146 [Tanacetum coccineum]
MEARLTLQLHESAGGLLRLKQKCCRNGPCQESAKRIFPLCKSYLLINQFVESRSQFKCGLVNHAFAAALRALLLVVNVKGKKPHKPKEEKDFSSNEVRLLKELLKEKTEQVHQMIKDQAKEYYENKATMQRKEEKEKEKETEARYSSEEFPPLGNSHKARPFMEAEVHYSGNTTTAPKIRKITNQLYNLKVEFEIPSCPMFGTTTIIDTRASTCCINKKVIPEDALEPLTQPVFFNGLNSR